MDDGLPAHSAQGREALIIRGSTADEAHIDDMADQVVAEMEED